MSVIDVAEFMQCEIAEHQSALDAVASSIAPAFGRALDLIRKGKFPLDAIQAGSKQTSRPRWNGRILDVGRGSDGVADAEDLHAVARLGDHASGDQVSISWTSANGTQHRQEQQ